MKTSTKPLVLALLVALSAPTLMYSEVASASEWQPVASDRLIKLPANIIEKRVEQDFNASPMAVRLADLESQMTDKTQRIASLQQDTQQLSGEQKVNAQYELVQQKSDYLDLLQESHTLRKQAALQKQQVYQDVLQQYRNEFAASDGSERFKIQQQQQEALSRMERAMAQVDQNLMHNGYDKESPYSDEYASNVTQIDKLKQAIAKHKANASPMLNGAEVSSEEYIRQLLLDASMHQSLLDQEALMLSYMARLVALDAQALEYEIAYGEEGNPSGKPRVAKASKAVSLFL